MRRFFSFPPESSESLSSVRRRPNKRLKLAARADCGMNLSSARRSLSAIRYAAHELKQSLLVVQ